MLSIVLAFGLLFSFQVYAQNTPVKTLLISDIDDTIKLANIPSLTGSARYALDEKSRFTGMSALYTLLTQESVGQNVYYLSNAPTWLMQETHQNFLRNGSFPQGEYFGRVDESAEVHKLKKLRAILKFEKPDRVILFGDNSERDPVVYAQIRREFIKQGIEFTTFIRLITTSPLAPEQIGFVTPVEVSLVLREKQLLSNNSVYWIVDNILPLLVEQRNWIDTGVVSFPDYVQCSKFQWSWDDSIPEFLSLASLKARIQEKCGSR